MRFATPLAPSTKGEPPQLHISDEMPVEDGALEGARTATVLLPKCLVNSIDGFGRVAFQLEASLRDEIFFSRKAGKGAARRKGKRRESARANAGQSRAQLLDFPQIPMNELEAIGGKFGSALA